MAKNRVIYNGVPMISSWPTRIEAAQQVTHYSTLDGRVLARIRYGDELNIGNVAHKPCRDCGVLKGQYHVGPICGLEQCPRCGGQFSSCDCNFVGDASGEEEFGTADDYQRAFEALRAEGIPSNHLALLRAHFAATDHDATPAQLAAAVGYASGKSANLQYGRLAKRVAAQLGVTEPPHGFWLYVLAGSCDEPGGENSSTPFYLRRPAIEALQRLGMLSPSGP